MVFLCNKSYHQIIKYSFLTFLRCHFTEGKEWATFYQPPNFWDWLTFQKSWQLLSTSERKLTLLPYSWVLSTDMVRRGSGRISSCDAYHSCNIHRWKMPIDCSAGCSQRSPCVSVWICTFVYIHAYIYTFLNFKINHLRYSLDTICKLHLKKLNCHTTSMSRNSSN